MRAAALLVVAAGAGVVVWAASRPESPRFATETAVNRRGGYSFAHPARWRVDREGTASTLTSPPRDVVIAFGLAPEGTLRRGGRLLLAELRRTYPDLAIDGTQRLRIGELPAFMAAGSATNARGGRIRFLAIALRGQERNYAITVFTAADADPDEVLPRAQEIVGSFRPIDGG